MPDRRKNKENAKFLKESSACNLSIQSQVREKYVNIFLIFLLLAFGVYQAFIYWGHQQVPHPDFSCFALVGRQILSFQMPTDFKRVPLVGILQVLLGKIAGGRSPDFTGGWLLNSIAHCLTAVLFFLAAKKIIGRSAIWFAIIAIINPWGLQLLTEAIAETTLLFFVWLTLYFIFKRSRWAYLFACLTSMVRYEGAALIFAAFVLDVIEKKHARQRAIAFALAAIASIPLGLWLAGTILSSQGMGTTHYLNVFTKEYMTQFIGGAEGKTGIKMHANMLWQVGFFHLFFPDPKMGQEFEQLVVGFSKFLVLTSFLFGSVYGLWQKRWEILVILIFVVPYFLLHSAYPYPMQRYHNTIFAMVFLVCIYGLQQFWQIAIGRLKLPQGVVVLLQIVLIVITAMWALSLFGYLDDLAKISVASRTLPYAAMVVVIAAFVAEYFASGRAVLKHITIVVLMFLMIISNQVAVAGIVGNGGRDIEFKYLADWYVQNAKKDEKLVSTMANLLMVLLPEYKDNFIEIDAFTDANSPEEFIQKCYEKDITYVVWDSRIGLAPADSYYKIWKIQNIAMLGAGRSAGPFEFITTLKASNRRYVHIYRLRPASDRQ